MRVTTSDLSWISKSLDAACLRVRGSNPRPKVLSVLYIPDGDRLSCIVEAACVADIDQLFGVALLPSARVLDAIVVAPLTSRSERC